MSSTLFYVWNNTENFSAKFGFTKARAEVFLNSRLVPDILSSRSLTEHLLNPIEKESATKSARIIKTIRTERGWTQSELATRLGISQSALSKLEAGKLVPSSLLWFTFCAMAGIQPESLISGEPQKLTEVMK
jgi:DNA-binding XRE family transcriptional regulator